MNKILLIAFLSLLSFSAFSKAICRESTYAYAKAHAHDIVFGISQFPVEVAINRLKVARYYLSATRSGIRTFEEAISFIRKSSNIEIFESLQKSRDSSTNSMHVVDQKSCKVLDVFHFEM